MQRHSLDARLRLHNALRRMNRLLSRQSPAATHALADLLHRLADETEGWMVESGQTGRPHVPESPLPTITGFTPASPPAGTPAGPPVRPPVDPL